MQWNHPKFKNLPLTPVIPWLSKQNLFFHPKIFAFYIQLYPPFPREALLSKLEYRQFILHICETNTTDRFKSIYNQLQILTTIWLFVVSTLSLTLLILEFCARNFMLYHHIKWWSSNKTMPYFEGESNTCCNFHPSRWKIAWKWVLFSACHFW